MARNRSDREDLLREATALPDRVELQCGTQTVVAGYRRNGALSVFFDASPVYQFNTDDQLRRAHVDDCLIKAVDHRLIRMRRVETETATELHSAPLEPSEQQQLLDEATAALSRLLEQLRDNQTVIVGEVCTGGSVVQRLREHLDRLLSRPLLVADRPHAGS